MDKKKLIEKIIQKKEFSQLPKRDVELSFEKFDKDIYCDEEKIKLTRDLLRKVFSGFTSRKILSPKDKNFEWILRKHLSTRERLPYYEEVYQRILNGLGKQINIIDLGAGINGFSYNYIRKLGYDINYVGIEAIGQFVELMNNYFEREKIKGKAISLSLFNLLRIKNLIKIQKKPRIVLLFKTIDSLEMLKKNYSKKLILEIAPLVERIVVSFATESMAKRTKFRVKRNWIVNFIRENFKVRDDFELGGERYLVFSKK